MNDDRLKLRMAAASRSRDAATGSLKRTAEGNRASGGSPAKADQREAALACRVAFCGAPRTIHNTGLAESSAKGTERFLFQPAGLPEGRKVWRQPEPDFSAWRQRGGAPERATCEPRSTGRVFADRDAG